MIFNSYQYFTETKKLPVVLSAKQETSREYHK